MRNVLIWDVTSDQQSLSQSPDHAAGFYLQTSCWPFPRHQSTLLHQPSHHNSKHWLLRLLRSKVLETEFSVHSHIMEQHHWAGLGRKYSCVVSLCFRGNIWRFVWWSELSHFAFSSKILLWCKEIQIICVSEKMLVLSDNSDGAGRDLSRGSQTISHVCLWSCNLSHSREGWWWYRVFHKTLH